MALRPAKTAIASLSLLLVGGLLWLAFSRSSQIGGRREASAAATTTTAPAGPAARDPGRRSPPPRWQPEAAAATVEMPEGLASDLAMFNDDQIRAELESILISYPAVKLVSAVCPSLPCRAAVASSDVEVLNQSVQAVSNRFQGFMATEFRVKLQPGGADLVEAHLLVGTDRPRLPPLFERAGLR